MDAFSWRCNTLITVKIAYPAAPKSILIFELSLQEYICIVVLKLTHFLWEEGVKVRIGMYFLQESKYIEQICSKVRD